MLLAFIFTFVLLQAVAFAVGFAASKLIKKRLPTAAVAATVPAVCSLVWVALLPNENSGLYAFAFGYAQFFLGGVFGALAGAD
jgi:hypothetical protein